MATVKDLIQIRSASTEATMKWLQCLADALDQTDWRFSGKSILASEIGVDAFVYTRRRKKDKRNGRDRSAERVESERSAIDESVAHLYEQPLDWEEWEKKRWRQAIQRPGIRLGVRGAPGGGKTFLTRESAQSLARESAGRITRREVSPSDIPVPFWITAGVFAATTGSDAVATVVDATLLSIEQINRQPSLPPRDWLRKAAASPNALIMVDALDQLVTHEVEGFKRSARRLDTLPGRLIATCRTLHWDERASWLAARGKSQPSADPAVGVSLPAQVR